MSNETACVTRRTKGDGTIFQNKKGRWIARYKRKGFPPKEFSGKTRAEAQAKMDEYKFLVLSGNLVNHLLPLEEYVYFVNSYATSFSKKLCQFPYFLFKEFCRCLKLKNPPWIIIYPGFYIFNVPVLFFVKIFPFWNMAAD